MGACVCRPKTEVTENPEVVMYTKVGGTAQFTKYGGIYLSGAFNGLVYIQDNQLCYEATCGSRLWCKCIRKRWDLSQVKEITIVKDETVVVPGNKFLHYVHMRPGLKISFFSRISETLITDMPDALNFSTQLAQHLGGKPLQDMDLQARVNANLYTTVYTAHS